MDHQERDFNSLSWLARAVATVGSRPKGGLIRYEELGRILEVMYELTDYYVQGGRKKLAFKRPAWFLTPE